MARIALLFLAVPVALAAAPPPREDDAGKILRLYGEVIDPDNDCKFILTGTKIVITVPGSDHILAYERGKTNAPRVMKEWDGDFQASVTLDGPIPKTAKSAVEGRKPFNGAGLLVYADDKNYIRFERARVLQPDGGFICYASWELRQDGQWVRAGSTADGELDPDKPVSFRIVRTGDKFDGSYSTDGGKTWKELEAIPAKLPAKVKVGIMAGHNTDTVFAPTFENLKIEKRDGK